MLSERAGADAPPGGLAFTQRQCRSIKNTWQVAATGDYAEVKTDDTVPIKALSEYTYVRESDAYAVAVRPKDNLLKIGASSATVSLFGNENVSRPGTQEGATYTVVRQARPNNPPVTINQAYSFSSCSIEFKY